MASQKKDKQQRPNLDYLKLAFDLAEINLGSTRPNPSVGCIVERNGSVISSGYTSLSGRPHAEYIALNKKINFKDANIYISLEPCSHYGKTPPCINIIKRKKLKNVFYSIDDYDLRSHDKSKQLIKKKINIKKNLLRNKGIQFYKSYYKQKILKLPLIDSKLAISKDYLTKNLKNRWITNEKSRRLTHLFRSRYEAIISTSRSINDDNSELNCRINGLEKKSPDLVIIDRKLKIKKNLKIFNNKYPKKIYLYTTFNNKSKIKWLKKKKVKVIVLKKMDNKKDFSDILSDLIKKNYSRLFVEAGLRFTNFLIKNKFLDNLYLFKSDKKLDKNGINYGSDKIIKNFKLKNKLQVNLNSDKIYVEKLK